MFGEMPGCAHAKNGMRIRIGKGFMLRKLISLPKKIMSSKNVGPAFLDDDVFLVSYPKSGSTWMRFLLANYISNGQVDILQINSVVPDVHFNPQDIVETLDPRIIKTHESYNPKYKRIVYIVRDGRDVAVSYYSHLKKFRQLADNISFSVYLDSYIGGELDPYGPWGEHVDGWLNGAKNILVIRYEDMLSDAVNVLEKTLRFCGLEFDEKKAFDAVTACSLSKLRQIEAKQFDEIKELSSSNPSIRFFRKGISGDWKNHFNKNDHEKFNAAFAMTMNRVGYGDKW